jgi:hypothetical protein
MNSRVTNKVTNSVTATLDEALVAVDFEQVYRSYWEQNEFVVIKGFLPPELMESVLSVRAEELKPRLNRNYIPGYKKGGSISYFTLQQHAPEYIDLYRSDAFLEFMSRLVKTPLLLCPERDSHSCALYYYTEPGDHIGFHYDTSYYKGARYTVLLGLVDKAQQCQLVCQLYKDDPERETQELSLITEPGDLVIFNGDKLCHAVTPLGEGEERVVLTMEYLTTREIGHFHRFYSDLKDAFAYFGVRTVFGKSS